MTARDTDVKIIEPDESQAAAEDLELNSWLWRLKGQIKTAFRQTKLWINDHVYLEYPYLQNPHPQYWHKIRDPAWAHLYFQDFVNAKSVPVGGVITNYTGNIIDDWQLVSDPVAGTIIADADSEYPELGTYFLSVSGYIEGTQNTDYMVSMYADGVVTVGRMPVVLKGNATNVPISWAGLVIINDAATLDLRLEFSSNGVPITFYTLNWCLHRISPLGGVITINDNDMPSAPPVDQWNPG